jgi:hypothetical protein
MQNFYYANMTALRDKEIQKKGVVMLLYGIGQETFHSDRLAKLARMLCVNPVSGITRLGLSTR